MKTKFVFTGTSFENELQWNSYQNLVNYNFENKYFDYLKKFKQSRISRMTYKIFNHFLPITQAVFF